MTVALTPAAASTVSTSSTTNAANASKPTTSTAPVVVQRSSAALSAQAVDLSGQSAVVATLGGYAGGASVYSAAGLLATLQQAGASEESLAVPKDGSNTDTSQTAQQALDRGVLSDFAAAGNASGIYTVGGGNGLSDQASSNWADILKSNPSYASTVIGSSFASGIIATLSVSA